jgi:serine-type D-Ala-D-Ala carboxypeptidase
MNQTPFNEAPLKKWEPLIESSIAKNDCPGAVVLIRHDGKTILRKAYGSISIKPEKKPMTEDVIFDLASLTKPIATGLAIAKLMEDGKISPDDPVAKHWPAFAASEKKNVTVAQCLLHTSGLTADNAVADYQDGKAKALERIAVLKLEAEAGKRFKYSDVGYIVLGHLVERISGESLDSFVRKHFFEPMNLSTMTYKPESKLKDKIAPTGLRKNEIIRGEVHDPRAFLMDGVAGHAGLFGTADDIAKIADMLLNDGKFGDKVILKPETVKTMLEPRNIPGGFRNYGWDVDSPYTAQAGLAFKRQDGFGHTGFTGTSLWVDRPSKTMIILLTNRVHPEDKGNVVGLRRELGTLVGECLGLKPQPKEEKKK